MADGKSKVKIKAFEDGKIEAEIVTAGDRNCDNVAELFNAFGPNRNQSTKEDGDCRDVYKTNEGA